jgi:hypothetical protein
MHKGITTKPTTIQSSIISSFVFISLILQIHQMHYQTLLVNAHNRLASFHL